MLVQCITAANNLAYRWYAASVEHCRGFFKGTELASVSSLSTNSSSKNHASNDEHVWLVSTPIAQDLYILPLPEEVRLYLQHLQKAHREMQQDGSCVLDMT